MTEFVNNDSGLQVSVTIRTSSVPQVHPAAPVLTIWRSHEIRVVESTTILSVGDDRIILLTATAEIMLLEIASNFVKAVSVTRK
jgi:hypothetical protein